jgi:hypothetical protein
MIMSHKKYSHLMTIKMYQWDRLGMQILCANSTNKFWAKMIIVLIDLWIKKWVISSKYAVEEIILLI